MSVKISIYDKFKPISNARYVGNFGKCYKYNDMVIKIFDNENNFISKFNVEKNLSELTKYKVNGVALPTNLVYKDNVFCGYTMPYFNGPTLAILLAKIQSGRILISDNELFSLYYSLFLKINELTKLNIKVNDIKPDNIIYYNNELMMVDCDFYKVCKNNKGLYEYNVKQLNDCFNKIDLFKKIIYEDKDKPIRKEFKK